MPDDGGEKRFSPDDRDVRSMQRSDRFRGGPFGGQHGACLNRSHGVGNGVMGMQHVQFFPPAHVDDATSQCHFVGWELEERVV